MNKTVFTWLKIVLFIVFFTFIDQLTKYMAKSHLSGKNKEVTIIKNILAFRYLNGGNNGAAWGILSGRVPILIVFTIIVVIIICFLIRNTQMMISGNYSLNIKTLIFLKYLLSLLIAGAIGNIIDRIMNGYVIDFICFKFIDFPIFNVADIYVSVSCFLIVIICIFGLKEKEFNMIFSFRKPKLDVK